MKSEDIHSLAFWNSLMGRDLPRAERQPLQPVMIEDGKLKLNDLPDVLKGHFVPGATVGFRREASRICLQEVEDGVAVVQDDDGVKLFELPPDVLAILPQESRFPGMLIVGGGKMELVPMRVEEHAADVLGPRVIDEVRRPADAGGAAVLVRHLVRGFEYAELTPDRLAELEDVVCVEPFAHDPVEPLAEGGDWTAWQTRDAILKCPLPDDEAIREQLLAALFEDQRENGSWGDSPLTTGYAILRALSLRVADTDARVRRAAQWLLAWPEPEARPGMWMIDEERLGQWNSWARNEVQLEFDKAFLVTCFTDADHDLFRGPGHQEVMPTCSRHHGAGCDFLHHPSAAAAEALCRCGYADHPRLKAYAATMLRLHAKFGYFCACWGILDPKRGGADENGGDPDFNHCEDQRDIALKAVPYRYARDNEDIHVLARRPWYPGEGRPMLADTNWQPPYAWKDIGSDDCYAVVGSYWQNGDCWAKANRALSQFPGWSGSTAEFFGLFQGHLYQTPLGEWHQAFPAGILRWLTEVTRNTRTRCTIEQSEVLRFAKAIVLKSVPWLRLHQKDDGTWDHEELPRHTKTNRPPGRRLGTYHIISALNEFGLLRGLRP